MECVKVGWASGIGLDRTTLVLGGVVERDRVREQRLVAVDRQARLLTRRVLDEEGIDHSELGHVWCDCRVGRNSGGKELLRELFSRELDNWSFRDALAKMGVRAPASLPPP